ncbi:hypothetical protein HOK00_04660 [bacterium]|nr:hypothetical protein [bacterium]
MNNKYSFIFKSLVFALGLFILSIILLYFNEDIKNNINYKLPKPHFVIKSSLASEQKIDLYFKTIIETYFYLFTKTEFKLFANEFLSPYKDPKEFEKKDNIFKEKHLKNKAIEIENFKRMFGKGITIKNKEDFSLNRYTHMKYKANIKISNRENREAVMFYKVYFDFDETGKMIDFDYIEDKVAKNLNETKKTLEVFDENSYFRFFSKKFFQKEKSRKIITASPSKIKFLSIVNVEGISYVKVNISFRKQKFLKNGNYIFYFLKTEIIDFKKAK